jgi:competence protein ComEA
MFEPTPQERLALLVIAVLLTGGGVARYVVARAEARPYLEYSADVSDSLSPGGSGSLRTRVEGELAIQRIRSTPLQPAERIDPNTAPPEQLARLPRIGPALADRIVAHRQANGAFRSLEDLRAVPGIGPALLAGIAPHLTLTPAAESRPPAAPGPSPQASAPGTGVGSAGSGGDSRIDVNSASAAELVALPGVGPAIAQRIVEHRERHGRFRSFADLEAVSGIGPRVRERIEAAARLGP